VCRIEGTGVFEPLREFVYSKKRHVSKVCKERAVNPLAASIEKKIASIPMPVRVTLPDGTQLGASDYRVAIALSDNKSLMHLAAGSIGHLGQDYVEGRVQLEGSMRDLMAAASSLLSGSPADGAHASWLASVFKRGISLARHTIERDARQIEFHYDLSDDFYALWLDPRRVY